MKSDRKDYSAGSLSFSYLPFFLTAFLHSNPSTLIPGNLKPQPIVTYRKEVIDRIVRNPSLTEVPIRKPLFVLGMARTGSTLLYNLLDQDPNNRSPKFWEFYYTNKHLSTPPKSPEVEFSEAARKNLQQIDTIAPGYIENVSKSHVLDAMEIEECFLLMMHQQLLVNAFVCTEEPYLEWFFLFSFCFLGCCCFFSCQLLIFPLPFWLGCSKRRRITFTNTTKESCRSYLMDTLQRDIGI